MEVFAFPFVLSGVYCRFAYESFRQLPVRYKLLKSFRVRFGSLPQLLSPYQWLKERGIYKRIALFLYHDYFCIMCKYIYIYIYTALVSLRGETTEVVSERDVGETTGRPFRYVFI